jgi:hypothetical protein
MVKENFVFGKGKGIVFLLVMAALAELSLFGCNDQGKIAAVSREADPPTNFRYDLNEAGDGVVIHDYLGEGGAVVIPAEIEGVPVVGIADESWRRPYRGVFSDPLTSEARKRKAISSVVIPDSVTYIGIGAFLGCHDLKTVTLPKNLDRISGKTFLGCSSLTSVRLPEGLKAIEERAFADCKSLTSITLPDGLETIEKEAFRGCSSLTSVRLPDGLETIEEEAFRDCSSLTSVRLPEGLKAIEEKAFWKCESLVSITLPESLETIEHNAFRACTGLVTVEVPNHPIQYPHSPYNSLSSAYEGCSRMSLASRKKLRDSGYTDSF